MTAIENLSGVLAEEAFPGEVVTRAIVRDVDLGAGSGLLALITLDNGHDHTKPSTFGPQGLLSLNAALDAVAARPEVRYGLATMCVGMGMGGTVLWERV